MNQLEFDNLAWLHLLWAVAAVVLIGLYGLWRRRAALRRLADARLLPELVPPAGTWRHVLRLGLVTLALLLLVAALLGPRWGTQTERVYRRNVDVLVLLDVSKSMLAQDVSPSRLARAKLAISDELLSALGGDRIGLMTFAGVARLKCPLTSDYGFFRLVLDDVSPESSPRGGTSIGDALRAVPDAFDSPLDSHKLVLLITDGEDQDSYPGEAAAGLWEDHRIPVVAIGLGDEQDGARIPLPTPQGVEYLQHEGETVWTRANFATLRDVAGAGPLSAFVPVGTEGFDLGRLYQERVLPAIEYHEETHREEIPRPSRTYPLVVAAFAVLLAEALLGPGPRFARRLAQQWQHWRRTERAA